MTYEKLDHIFPYVIFIYGILCVLVLSSDTLLRLGRERMPADLWTRFQSHKIFAWISAVVGGLWILQNLWL
jgi:hypothetical protein